MAAAFANWIMYLADQASIPRSVLGKWESKHPHTVNGCCTMLAEVSESTVRRPKSKMKQIMFCDSDIWVISIGDVEAVLMRNVCRARLKYD